MIFDNSQPIYLQIIHDIKKKLIMKQIRPGEQLPSTRNLALEYQINPNTAARIYKELEIMDLCHTKRGLGTFVTDSKDHIASIRDEMAQSLINHFIDEMQALGYTKAEMLEKIQKGVY